MRAPVIHGPFNGASYTGYGPRMAGRTRTRGITSLIACTMANDDQDKGSMTTREAGRKGGERVRELVEEGKESESNDAGNA